MKTFFYIINGGDTEALFPDPQKRGEYFARWGEWIKDMMGKKAFVSGFPLKRQGKIISREGIIPLVPTPFDATPAAYGFLTATSIEEAGEFLKSAPLAEESAMIELRELQNMPTAVLE